jgi:hypothetical protein
MWFNYPVEKHIIRFYKYRFNGLDKPLIIEAYNKLEARQKLLIIMEKIEPLRNLRVVDESISLPIFGRTYKKIKSVVNVWVGNNISSSGWMPLEEFEKMNYDY